ncbi:hypothetical protein PACTADRAFT_49878 [Pachysolen tannophilus NRRL Y-2460]|uniref:Skg3/CAF120-like PH-like domain-containing protein n=1 Tax=Pachysolen tannophilus NRRL Y-2460 TaxID=669874 RepID=A0A1E4TTQ8_PACTA|nr:hypothetical protein PACTADRAFT_49878 [Pachysolen tannophilus NRRL Y-2460]
MRLKSIFNRSKSGSDGKPLIVEPQAPSARSGAAARAGRSAVKIPPSAAASQPPPPPPLNVKNEPQLQAIQTREEQEQEKRAGSELSSVAKPALSVNTTTVNTNKHDGSVRKPTPPGGAPGGFKSASSKAAAQKRISSVPTSFLRQRSNSGRRSPNSAIANGNGDSTGSGSGSGSGLGSASGSGGSLPTPKSSDPSKIIENPNIPKELVPIITLIQAQQARIYYDGLLKIPAAESTSPVMTGIGVSVGAGAGSDSASGVTAQTWYTVEVKLSGTELVLWEPEDDLTATTQPGDSLKPSYINIADAKFVYRPNDGNALSPLIDDNIERSLNDLGDNWDLNVILSNSKSYLLRFDSELQLKEFYASLLLSQFEYRQLQESFTGALLSAKGLLLSDIRTLLAPENRHAKEEWCVLRFPFLNNKWIKCFVVVTPGEKSLRVPTPGNKNSTNGDASDTEKKNSRIKPGKIQIYTSNKTTKKNLLATIVNGRSCYTVYPENPDFIDNNGLLHITGDIIINQDKLSELTSGDSIGHSLSKKPSTSSLASFKTVGSKLAANGSNAFMSPINKSNRSLSANNSKFHIRSSSAQSVESLTSSFSNKKNINLTKTSLCLLIPEIHPSVKQFDTMFRLLIPILNTFKLYGRPAKFLSQRQEKESLLFGLPQLPHTEYLDSITAIKLVELNINNSIQENWNGDDWTQVFKEMISFKLTNGWTGSGSIFEVFKEGLIYTKEKDLEAGYPEFYDTEDEELEFMGSNNGSIASTPRNTTFGNVRSRSSSFRQLSPNPNDGSATLHKPALITSTFNGHNENSRVNNGGNFAKPLPVINTSASGHLSSPIAFSSELGSSPRYNSYLDSEDNSGSSVFSDTSKMNSENHQQHQQQTTPNAGTTSPNLAASHNYRNLLNLHNNTTYQTTPYHNGNAKPDSAGLKNPRDLRDTNLKASSANSSYYSLTPKEQVYA